MNEVFNTAGFEQRVRDRAYALWESEGRPMGRDAEHWRMSEEATLAEITLPASAKGLSAKPLSTAPLSSKPLSSKPAHAKHGARKRAASRH
jgi:hypothetical protein